MESDPENNSYFQQGTMRIKMESESECTSAVNDSDHVKTHDSSRTASNYPMADKPDEPMDLTDLPLPSRSNGPVKTQDAAASTSGTPFAKTQIAIPSEIRKKKKKRIAAPKSSAQRQREYRQRIAASRTPAQATATRISDTERKRNYRLRKAANLTLTSGSLESTTASSSHSPGKSNDVQNSTQRQLTNQQRQSLATEPAQTTVQPSTSSDQIKVPAASTSAKPFPQPPPIAARKSSARRQNDRRNIETYKMTSTDTYQLKWHSHSSHLNGSVAALLRSERFTDVVLCTMDGSQIPAHKFILSSCSVYLSNLFEGQRSVTRMGGMLYVVLPSEISTKALKILVEYMYKGETTVSNEVLDTVLKAGEVLKIRGLWRQTDEAGGDSTPAEKTTAPATAVVNKQILPKKPEDSPAPKILVKKDDKLLKAFNPVQQQGGVNRPMFIGPPKLVFIKTTEGGTQAALRPGAPKGQTILVAPAPQSEATCTATVASPSPSNTLSVSTSIVDEESPDEAPPPRMLRRHAAERKYGKRQKTEITVEAEEAKDCDNSSETSKKSSTSNIEIQSDIQVKDEPDWDASSIEEEERSIAEMFQAEMSVKSEPIDEVDIDEDSLVYSPLACELCAEVFTLPAAWVRHVQAHAAGPDHTHARKRKCRSASDDTEETTALLRCDLCQKHFPNPAEWVRHIQSTHTETEGAQNKNCPQCKKSFPSHASMLIHMRTHTGERPFVCGLCNKGFNVKSNLLRHLRTLHDQVISPQVEDEPDEVTPGPSEIKRES